MKDVSVQLIPGLALLKLKQFVSIAGQGSVQIKETFLKQ